MSNPSFSNIDRWLFELMEGNLSPEQIAQLEAFLLRHPELDVDKDMWELAKVESSEIVYPNQQRLVKRRPVGIYMSLGFASIALLISIGIFNQIEQNGFVNSDGTLHSVEQNMNTGSIPSNEKETSPYESKKSSKLNTTDSENQYYFNQNKSKIGSPDRSTPAATNLISNTPFSDQFTKNEIGSQNLNGELVESVVEINTASNKTNLTLSKSEMREENDIDAQNVDISELETEEVKEVVSDETEQSLGLESSIASNRTTFSKSDYKMSFGSRLNKMGRSIQRMMDNPVALKNMKDPYYHVPGMQAMDVNFGAVGTLLATRVQTITRAQWLGEENQQLINQISIDGYSYGMRGGLGMQFNHNYYGEGGIQNYNAAFIYSPKFSVARNVVVEPSLRFKMGSKKLNNDQLTTGTIVEYDRMNAMQFYNDGTTPIGQTLWYKDLGAGLMVNTRWFFIGLQVDNLFEHYDNIYSSDQENPNRSDKHFIGTIGTDYESSKENMCISPYIVYQNQGNLSEGWLGVNFRYHWLTIGGAISSGLQPAASLGLKFDHFMITYNADYTQSQMLQKPSLSHQVTIRFLSKPSRVGQRLLNQ